MGYYIQEDDEEHFLLEQPRDLYPQPKYSREKTVEEIESLTFKIKILLLPVARLKPNHFEIICNKAKRKTASKKSFNSAERHRKRDYCKNLNSNSIGL